MQTIHVVVTEHLEWVVIGLAVLNIMGLVAAAVAASRSAVVTRRFGSITGAGDSQVDSLQELVGAVSRQQDGLSGLAARVDELSAESRRHLKRIGLVRYDAFEGVAGQQSYSLCLLDDERDGILLSSLVGSNFSRGYAVRVSGGQAARKLGDEETRALGMAASGETPEDE